MKKSDWLALFVTVLLVGSAVAFTVIRQSSVVRSLCHAERAQIARQGEQTRRLLASGITFGIPKSQLPVLVKQSEASQERFLRDLHCD